MDWVRGSYIHLCSIPPGDFCEEGFVDRAAVMTMMHIMLRADTEAPSVDVLPLSSMTLVGPDYSKGVNANKG
jgi:hypothetical protein